MQIVAVAQRHAGALDAEQRYRVPQDEPQHFAQPKRFADGTGHIGQRLGRTPFTLTLGVPAGIGDRRGRLRRHRGQDFLVFGRVQPRMRGVHGEHAKQSNPDAHRHGQHGGGCT